MVVKVALPVDDSVDTIKRTLKERVKHKRFYERITDELIGRAQLYEETRGDPELIKPIDLRAYTETDDEASARKKSLIKLYSPKPNKLPYSQLERIRKENGLVVCPSCGEPGRPRTLDHYLPKNSFPELSILLVNLTPMCDWCQGNKLDEYLTPDGHRRYLHPYYDDVDKPLFSVTFSPPYNTPEIDIVVHDSLDSHVRDLVDRHLEGIKFLPRYKVFFTTRYMSILRMARDCRRTSNCLRDRLKLFLDMESEKAINSWEAILFRSVIEDKILMDFLENDPLPDYL